MTLEMLGTASISANDGAAHGALPKRVYQTLGEPDNVVYFLDRDDGSVTIVAESEVTLK